MESVISMFYYVAGFIILLGVLVFFHEAGHFLTAKLVGVKVLKFSLGFGPAIVRRTWGETEYGIGWVPLGGYVKLLGEDPESDEEVPEEEKPRAFTSKSVWARMAVVAAGPIANFVLAVVLLCVAFVAGMPVPAPEIGKVMADSPAMEAGLKTGDEVTAINGQAIRRWNEMRDYIQRRPDETLTLTVLRNGEKLDLQVTPVTSDSKNIFGEPAGRIGVMPSGRNLELTVPEAIVEGVRFTFHMTGLVVETLVRLVRFEISAKNLSGPITIVQVSGESLRLGLVNFLVVLSFISINLAVINLLPVPILDGGHLLFFLIEAIIRKPVTGRTREIAVQFGLLFIIFIFALVIYNDITRIITKGWPLAP